MNSTNNNSFEIAAKKVFSDLYALIKEDEKETEYKTDNKKTDDKNEIDNKNVISNKKDNKERAHKELMDREQIINGKTIQFRNFNSREICRSVNTKEAMKEYIFDYFNMEFPDIKTYASNAKIRLSNDDKRKCFWILFKRCKLIIKRNKVYYNKDVYNMDDNEEKEFFMEYLKLKNLSLPKNTTFEY
jgi:hypothetical protein